MDRQIRRYKGKVYRSEQGRRAGRSGSIAGAESEVTALDEAQAAEDLLEAPEVVRSKRFLMTLMTVEEAITEMEMLSHRFFLFYNSEAEQYDVVYCRQDGAYGVIEPELA